jgi:hypothetical protein
MSEQAIVTKTLVVHHRTRARRWKCYVRPEGDGVGFGAFSRSARERGVGGWIPERFETAPAALITDARAAARRLQGEG